jgi:hypothetical protein
MGQELKALSKCICLEKKLYTVYASLALCHCIKTAGFNITPDTGIMCLHKHALQVCENTDFVVNFNIQC